MLIENKFIYLSLPRCASSSFLSSCMNQNLKVQHFNKGYDIETQNKKYNVDIDLINLIESKIIITKHNKYFICLLHFQRRSTIITL